MECQVCVRKAAQWQAAVLLLSVLPRHSIELDVSLGFDDDFFAMDTRTVFVVYQYHLAFGFIVVTQTVGYACFVFLLALSRLLSTRMLAVRSPRCLGPT